jgi:hypothetical protein
MATLHVATVRPINIITLIGERRTTIPDTEKAVLLARSVGTASDVIRSTWITEKCVNLAWQVKLLERDAFASNQSPHETVIDSALVQRRLGAESRQGHGFPPFTTVTKIGSSRISFE